MGEKKRWKLGCCRCYLKEEKVIMNFSCCAVYETHKDGVATDKHASPNIGSACTGRTTQRNSLVDAVGRRINPERFSLSYWALFVSCGRKMHMANHPFRPRETSHHERDGSYLLLVRGFLVVSNRYEGMGI